MRTVSRVLLSCGLLWFGCAEDTRDAHEVRVEDAELRISHIPRQSPGGSWIAAAAEAHDRIRWFEKSGTLYLIGVPLERLVAVAYGAPRRDVRILAKGFAAHYDAVVHPRDRAVESAHRMLRGLLERELGVRVTRRRVRTMAMVLMPAPDAVPLEPATVPSGVLDLGEGRLRAQGASMPQFVELLGRDVRRPVVDETGLSGHYDFLLEWDPGKGAFAFIQALGDVGLQLTPGVRELEQWVVEVAERSRAPSANGGANDEG